MSLASVMPRREGHGYRRSYTQVAIMACPMLLSVAMYGGLKGESMVSFYGRPHSRTVGGSDVRWWRRVRHRSLRMPTVSGRGQARRIPSYLWAILFKVGWVTDLSHPWLVPVKVSRMLGPPIIRFASAVNCLHGPFPLTGHVRLFDHWVKWTCYWASIIPLPFLAYKSKVDDLPCPFLFIPI